MDETNDRVHIARCMRAGAAELRKRSRKLTNASDRHHAREAFQAADLTQRTAQLYWKAAEEIDRAAEAYLATADQ
jgi:hypothetical protein